MNSMATSTVTSFITMLQVALEYSFRKRDLLTVYANTEWVLQMMKFGDLKYHHLKCQA